jgi:7-cyano-7-deazaguanine synthase
MAGGRELAVALVSGGMDSAVVAAIVCRDHEPAFLHLDYGQRTEARERRAFEAIPTISAWRAA